MNTGARLTILGAISTSILVCVLTSIVEPDLASANAPISSELTESNDNTNTFEDDQCQINKNFPNNLLQWCNLITKYANQNQVDPNLIAAMIWQESGGDPEAYSKSGAVGLMQIMPRDGLAANFQCINGPCFKSRPTIQELLDPEYNIQFGTKMISNLINRHGNERDALKAYGPMNVDYYYADIVLGIYSKYK